LKYSVIKSFWLLDFKGGSKVDQSNVSCPVLVVGEPGWEEIAEFASDWLNQVSD
jgi:hypothetical protein